MSNQAIEMITQLAGSHLTDAIVNAAKPVKTPRKKVYTPESASQYAKEVAENLMKMFGKDFGQLAEQIVDFAKSHPLDVPEKVSKKPCANAENPLSDKKVRKPCVKKAENPVVVVVEEPNTGADTNTIEPVPEEVKKTTPLAEPKKIKKPRAKKATEPTEPVVPVPQEPVPEEVKKTTPLAEPKKIKKPRVKKATEPVVSNTEEPKTEPVVPVPQEPVPEEVKKTTPLAEPKKIKKPRAKNVTEPTSDSESESEPVVPVPQEPVPEEVKKTTPLAEPKKIKKPRAKKATEPTSDSDSESEPVVPVPQEPVPEEVKKTTPLAEPKKIKKPRAKKVTEPTEPVVPIAEVKKTTPPTEANPEPEPESEPHTASYAKTFNPPQEDNLVSEANPDYYAIAFSNQNHIDDDEDPEMAGFNLSISKELVEEELSDIEED